MEGGTEGILYKKKRTLDEFEDHCKGRKLRNKTLTGKRRGKKEVIKKKKKKGSLNCKKVLIEYQKKKQVCFFVFLHSIGLVYFSIVWVKNQIATCS